MLAKAGGTTSGPSSCSSGRRVVLILWRGYGYRRNLTGGTNRRLRRAYRRARTGRLGPGAQPPAAVSLAALGRDHIPTGTYQTQYRPPSWRQQEDNMLDLNLIRKEPE